jgi:hypothetical protein
MNIYFFYKNENNSSWYDFTLEAWEENDNTYMEGKRVSSFSLMEKVRIHIAKNLYDTTERRKFHCARFDHEFGTDLCTGDRSKSVEEFRKDKTENQYSPMLETNHRNFQRFKKVMFEIYHNYPSVNYTEHLFKEAPACRILY